MLRDWGFPGGSDGKESSCSAGDLGLIPGLGRSPGGRHDNPLQYSCLESPHGQRSLVGYSPWVAKSWTQLSEGDGRGWDGWMASPARWTWVWVDSGSWWWTGRPGMLRFMGSQRVGHDWGTKHSTQQPPVWDFPGGASGKEPTCQCRRHRRRGFYPWVGKIPWRKAWQPTLVFLPWESHGQRSLQGYSLWGRRVRHDLATEHTISGEGKGTPLQYPCLENSMSGGACTPPQGCSPWGSEVSDTTEWLHFHFSLSCIGEGNGNPLQCSCLENPRDGGAWWASVCGVAQSWTRLKWLSLPYTISCI